MFPNDGSLHRGAEPRQYVSVRSYMSPLLPPCAAPRPGLTAKPTHAQTTGKPGSKRRRRVLNTCPGERQRIPWCLLAMPGKSLHSSTILLVKHFRQHHLFDCFCFISTPRQTRCPIYSNIYIFLFNCLTDVLKIARSVNVVEPETM